jgi:hypothetical protein
MWEDNERKEFEETIAALRQEVAALMAKNKSQEAALQVSETKLENATLKLHQYLKLRRALDEMVQERTLSAANWSLAASRLKRKGFQTGIQDMKVSFEDGLANSARIIKGVISAISEGDEGWKGHLESEFRSLYGDGSE